MDVKKPPEFTLELSADRSNVREVVKGILHTIFFHRVFTSLVPATHDVLDMTLPYVSTEDNEIENLIEKRTNAFIRHLESPSLQPASSNSITTTASTNSSNTSKPTHGTLHLQFLEKKRRKGWFVAKPDEETVWETWIVEVDLTTARSETEAGRNRTLMDAQLQRAVMKVVEIVNREKEHIPPITTTETNPFPYQISIVSKG